MASNAKNKKVKAVGMPATRSSSRKATLRKRDKTPDAPQSLLVKRTRNNSSGKGGKKTTQTKVVPTRTSARSSESVLKRATRTVSEKSVSAPQKGGRASSTARSSRSRSSSSRKMPGLAPASKNIKKTTATGEPKTSKKKKPRASGGKKRKPTKPKAEKPPAEPEPEETIEKKPFDREKVEDLLKEAIEKYRSKATEAKIIEHANKYYTDPDETAVKDKLVELKSAGKLIQPKNYYKIAPENLPTRRTSARTKRAKEGADDEIEIDAEPEEEEKKEDAAEEKPKKAARKGKSKVKPETEADDKVEEVKETEKPTVEEEKPKTDHEPHEEPKPEGAPPTDPPAEGKKPTEEKDPFEMGEESPHAHSKRASDAV